jgi:uncharacterized membrane protein YdjX (TVP38/TMEM64 family)
MRLFYWISGISLCFLAIWLSFDHQWQDWGDLASATNKIKNYGVSPAIIGIGLLIFDIILPIPSTIVMSSLGFLYGIWWGGFFSLAGSMSASLIGYGIGRLGGKKTALFFLGEKDYQRGKNLFDQGGGWIVTLSRTLPILTEALSITAGLLKMPLPQFFVSAFCGSLPISYLFAWIGSGGSDHPWLTFSMSFLVPAILWRLTFFIKRKINKNKFSH